VEELGHSGGQGRAGRSGTPSPAPTTASGSDDMPEAARSGPVARPVTPAGEAAEPIPDTIDWEKIEAAWADLVRGSRRHGRPRSE